MAKYLKSATGAVLSYNATLAKCVGVKEMTSDECAAHEASVRPQVKVTEPVAVVSDVVEVAVEPVVVVESEVAISDFEDGEPDVAEVLQALEVD